jgi:hypothetical protein
VPLLSIRAYAKHRAERGLVGTSHRGVQKAIQRGRISLTPEGLIDTDVADTQWADSTRARADHPAPGEPFAAKGNGHGKSLSFAEANAAERIWKAKLAQLEYEERAGLVVNADEVRAEWRKVIDASRTRLLGLPARVKTQLPHIEKADIAMIDALVREALEALSVESS